MVAFDIRTCFYFWQVVRPIAAAIRSSQPKGNSQIGILYHTNEKIAW